MRAVQGLGAAFIMPSTLSILTNVFGDPPNGPGPSPSGQGCRGSASPSARWPAATCSSTSGGARSSSSTCRSSSSPCSPSIVLVPNSKDEHATPPRLRRHPAVDVRAGEPAVRDHRGPDARLDEPGDHRLRRRGGGAAHVVRPLGAPHRPPDPRRHLLQEPSVHGGVGRRSRSCSSRCSGRCSSSASTCSSCWGSRRSKSGACLLPIAAVADGRCAGERQARARGSARRSWSPAGLGLVGLALLVFSRITVTSGYELVAVVLVIIGVGMGFAMAPGHGLDHGVAPAVARPGSARPSTTRPARSAARSASPSWAASRRPSTPARSRRTPAIGLLAAKSPQAAAAVSDSIGSASIVAAHLPASAAAVVTEAANAAFVTAHPAHRDHRRGHRVRRRCRRRGVPADASGQRRGRGHGWARVAGRHAAPVRCPAPGGAATSPAPPSTCWPRPGSRASRSAASPPARVSAPTTSAGTGPTASTRSSTPSRGVRGAPDPRHRRHRRRPARRRGRSRHR